MNNGRTAFRCAGKFNMGNRFQQALRIGMLGISEQIVDRSLFDNPAPLHHHDAIAHELDYIEVMAHEEVRQT